MCICKHSIHICPVCGVSSGCSLQYAVVLTCRVFRLPRSRYGWCGTSPPSTNPWRGCERAVISLRPKQPSRYSTPSVGMYVCMSVVGVGATYNSDIVLITCPFCIECVLCSNVELHPDEDRYRRVRVSSLKFNEQVWKRDCCRSFLLKSGWSEVSFPAFFNLYVQP